MDVAIRFSKRDQAELMARFLRGEEVVLEPLEPLEPGGRCGKLVDVTSLVRDPYSKEIFEFQGTSRSIPGTVNHVSGWLNAETERGSYTESFKWLCPHCMAELDSADEAKNCTAR